MHLTLTAHRLGLAIGAVCLALLMPGTALSLDDADLDRQLETFTSTVVRIDNPFGPDQLRTFRDDPTPQDIAGERQTIMDRHLRRLRTLVMDQIIRTPGFEHDAVYGQDLAPGTGGTP